MAQTSGGTLSRRGRSPDLVSPTRESAQGTERVRTRLASEFVPNRRGRARPTLLS